jgi:hypothetical protein
MIQQTPGGVCRLHVPVLGRIGAACAVGVAVMLPAAEPLHGSLPRNADGWTIFDPSPDTRTVYVSSSLGNDANSGLTPKDPVRTIARGESLLRTGMPDWLLLNRGDVWNTSLGDWRKVGRSANEPMLIGAYGEGPRPLLQTGNSNGFTAWRSSVNTYSNIAITGLHFHANGNIGSGGPTGILWHRPGENLLIEDVMIRGYKDNIVVQSVEPASPMKNVEVRRSVIVDSFALNSSMWGGGHSQGIYADNVHGILIEGNLFDHNGWNPKVPGAIPTIFNHNLYIQFSSSGLVVKDNIIARGASHGMQGRPGGDVYGNLFVDNAIAFDVRTTPGKVHENVVVHGSLRNLHPDGYSRGWGMDLYGVEGSEAHRNIVAHTPDGRFPIAGVSRASVAENIVYEWGPVSSIPAVDRASASTLPKYDLTIGGKGSIDSLLQQARLQSKDNWKPELTASAIVDYFLDGFDLGRGGDANKDGIIDILDLGILASNWQKTGRNWRHGDFNYDGNVDITDLGMLAANWQRGTLRVYPEASAAGMSFDDALASFQDIIQTPEPAGAMAALFTGTLLLHRRRRPAA